MKKIVFVGGGTLGHIYPMLPVVKRWKDKMELIFIGTKDGLEKALIEKLKYFSKTYYLSMQGFRRSLSLYNLKTLVMYRKCKKEARAILKEIKPDLVIGMGGYVSGVVVRQAIKCKIKTIIHEQNAVMGLANALNYKKVDKVFLSVPLVNVKMRENMVMIGNPRITDIYEANRVKNEQRNLIVVVGGSRGSRFINDTVFKAIPEFLSYGYELLVITGRKYFEEQKDIIKNIISDKVKVLPFTDNLIDYLKKARVVVSRSGATTLAELVALRKVSLLIPSPNVTSNHQERNADILVESQSALKLLEKDLTVDKLIASVHQLASDEDLRAKIVANIGKLANYNAVYDFLREAETLL